MDFVFLINCWRSNLIIRMAFSFSNCSLFLFIAFIGVTLVNNSIQVSGTQLHNTSSIHTSPSHVSVHHRLSPSIPSSAIPSPTPAITTLFSMSLVLFSSIPSPPPRLLPPQLSACSLLVLMLFCNSLQFSTNTILSRVWIKTTLLLPF